MLNGVLLVDHNELRPTMANTHPPNDRMYVIWTNGWHTSLALRCSSACEPLRDPSTATANEWNHHNTTHTLNQEQQKNRNQCSESIPCVGYNSGKKKKPTSRLANSTWNRIIASQRERERIYAANAHAKWNIPHIVALLYHVNASIFLLRSAYVRHRSQFNSLFVLRPPEHN